MKLSLVAGIAAATLSGSLAFLPAPHDTAFTAGTTHPVGERCGQAAWPYYENTCLRHLRPLNGRAPQVRLVSTDRQPAANPASQAAKTWPR